MPMSDHTPLLTLPIRERVPGTDPPMSPKHIDGCHGVRELHSSTRVAVPTQADLAAALHTDPDHTVDASHAAHIIEHSGKRVDELNGQLDGLQTGEKGQSGAGDTGLALESHKTSTRLSSPATGQMSEEPCPGCTHNTTESLDDVETLADGEIGFDGVHLAGGRGYWKRKVRKSGLRRVRERILEAVWECKRRVVALRTLGGRK